MDPMETRVRRIEEEISKLWAEYMKAVLSFPEESIDLHKAHHQHIAERQRLRKLVEDENAAAMRKAVRDLALFLLKCVLAAAVTGTGLYTVIGNQARSVIDAPRAVVEQNK